MEEVYKKLSKIFEVYKKRNKQIISKYEKYLQLLC